MSFIESRKKHVKRLCSDVKGSSARDFTDAFACIRKVRLNLKSWILSQLMIHINPSYILVQEREIRSK